MSDLREAVSLETIDRAIRAQLATDYGIESPYVVLPLPIESIPTNSGGSNWALKLDDYGISTDGLDAALQAAAKVASSFQHRYLS